MDDTMKSCREFVAVLASSAPAPGGGGAAALAAALGTALCLGAAADGSLASRLFFLGGALWLTELLRLHTKALGETTE